MSYEVFDDVAFYFLVQALLTLFVLFPTVYMVLGHLCTVCKKKPHGELPDHLNLSKLNAKVSDKKGFTDYIKIKYIVLGFFWMIYIYLWIQLPEYQKEELISFEPYEILGVKADASPAVLKKAYRKLSLKYHPDKNPDNQEAAEHKFLLVSKAYQTLTDPELRKNFDEFGSADGFQGATGSIGLPSWLTRKDNELHILLLYFLFLIVLPPICVFLWWRKASSYHALGVRNMTVRTYWLHITEQMAPKFLVEILAASDEFTSLNRPIGQDVLLKLWRELKDNMVRMKFVKTRKGEKPSGYVFKGTVLLYAYMLREPVPEILQPQLKLILKDAHRLLDVICEMCIGRQMYRPALSAVELMQSISQAALNKDLPLTQLPHFTEGDASRCRGKKIGTLLDFRSTPMERKMKICSHFSVDQWKDIEETLSRFPIATMDCAYEVEDEVGVYEHDFVTVTANFKRLGTEFFDNAQKEKAAQLKSVKTPNSKTQKKQKYSKKGKPLSKKTSGGRMSINKKMETEKENVKVESDEDIEARERRLLEELPTVPQQKKKDRSQAPVAYSSFYPFEKRETWYVFLIQSPRKGPQVIRFQKMYSLDDEIKMKIRMTTKGIYEYQLVAMCDAYYGCDIQQNFTITVKKMSKTVEDARDRLMGSKYDDDDDDEDEDEDEDAEGIWYYLGCTSAIELILNVIVIGLFGVFAYQFLQSRGIWQKYVDPILAVIWRVVGPMWNAVYPKAIEPWFTPLWSTLQVGFDKLAAYFPEPNITETEHVDL